MSVGNIIGDILAGIILSVPLLSNKVSSGGGWPFVMILPAVPLFIWGLVIWAFFPLDLNDNPSQNDNKSTQVDDLHQGGLLLHEDHLLDKEYVQDDHHIQLGKLNNQNVKENQALPFKNLPHHRTSYDKQDEDNLVSNHKQHTAKHTESNFKTEPERETIGNADIIHSNQTKVSLEL
jgi:hypothetical protein